MFDPRTVANRSIMVAALGAVLWGPAANADLEEVMEEKWGALVNSTSSKAYEAGGRGVLSGGSLEISNDTMNANPISFNPPGIRAGCGGINLYGGSFSMFDKDRWIQLARNIASNAVGYSFQLAMQNMCPSCSQLMQKIQDQIQQVNQYLGNSCKAAKALVPDNSIKNNTKQWGQKARNFATGEGWVTDEMAARSKGSSSDTTEAQSQTATKSNPSDPNSDFSKALNGNIVWEALQKSNASSWWTAGGDTEMNETIMSLTGTMIMTADSDAEADPRYKSAKINVEDLVKGGQVKIYDCSGLDRCLPSDTEGSLDTKQIQFKGYRKKIKEMLLGGGPYSVGVVEAIMANKGGLHNDQKAFLNNVPLPITGALHNLGNHVGLGKTFARATANDLAIMLAQETIREIQKAVGTALNNYDKPLGAKQRARFQKRMEKLKEQVKDLDRPNEANSRFLQAYRQLMDSLSGDTPAMFTTQGG